MKSPTTMPTSLRRFSVFYAGIVEHGRVLGTYLQNHFLGSSVEVGGEKSWWEVDEVLEAFEKKDYDLAFLWLNNALTTPEGIPAEDFVTRMEKVCSMIRHLTSKEHPAKVIGVYSAPNMYPVEKFIEAGASKVYLISPPSTFEKLAEDIEIVMGWKNGENFRAAG